MWLLKSADSLLDVEARLVNFSTKQVSRWGASKAVEAGWHIYCLNEKTEFGLGVPVHTCFSVTKLLQSERQSVYGTHRSNRLPERLCRT